jgi:hypothetical protein
MSCVSRFSASRVAVSTLPGIAIAFLLCADVSAQSGCQLVPQTILEPQTVTNFRWELQTEYETRQVTVAKPITVTGPKESHSRRALRSAQADNRNELSRARGSRNGL